MDNQTADRRDGSDQEPGVSSVPGPRVALVQGTALRMALGRALPLVQGAAVPQSGSPHGANDRSLIDEFYSPDSAVATTQRERS